jgi:ABC-type transport system substrate-binding protein
LFQTLGLIGGTAVAGDLLPLLAEAAKRKQTLRVIVDRDFESLRPDTSAGYIHHMLKRLLYTTSLLWDTHQRPDGLLTYDLNTIEPLLLSAYKVSEDRQLIEFTSRDHAKFANGDPLNAQALKESCTWLLATGGTGAGQLKVNGLPSTDRIEVVDEVTVRLHLDCPVAWGLYGNALLGTSIIHAKEILKHATADDPYESK